MLKQLRSAGIVGVGSAVPARVLTNADLEKMVDTTDEWITERTGIRERRVADPGTASSDLGAEAAAKALQMAGVSAADVDLIIVATVTPDSLFPSTACMLQQKIGATKAAAFDLLAGCSGFIYGLDMGWRAVASGGYHTVVVIGSDCLTRITDFTDRSTCVLFGDGAGAAVIQPVPEGYGVLATTLGADGTRGDKLMLPAGGSRMPLTQEVLDQKLQYIKMCGSDVYKFAVRIMGEAAVAVMEKAGLSSDEVDLFIPHQANIRIIEAAAKRLAFPSERVFVNVQKYGNTSAASIPLALDEAWREGRIRHGDHLVLVGFGAGLTWASAALRWAVA